MAPLQMSQINAELICSLMRHALDCLVGSNKERSIEGLN